MLFRFAAVTFFFATIGACVDDTSQDSQASTVGSDSDGDGGCRRPHGPPPPEAIDACDGLAAADDCTFTIDGHTINGKCHEGPVADAPLACAPPPPPPPQEALDACTGADAGDACTFDHDGHTVDGTCKNGPDGNGPLACAPSQPPPPP